MAFESVTGPQNQRKHKDIPHHALLDLRIPPLELGRFTRMRPVDYSILFALTGSPMVQASLYIICI